MTTIPLPVIPLTFRCAIVHSATLIAKPSVNVIHIRARSGTATSDDAFNALNSSVVAGMWSPLPNTNPINTVNIIPLDGHSPTVAYSTGGGSKWSGGTQGDPMSQVCVLVSVHTSIRGRKGRGRVYLGPACEFTIANGQITSAAATLVQNGWTTFMANLAAVSPIGWDFGVAHYDRANGGAGAGFTPAAGVFVNTLTATQRRRQPGRKIARHRATP